MYPLDKLTPYCYGVPVLINTPMARIEFVTINDLAKRFGINKSRVNFWVSQGLIRERGVVGRTKFFEREYAIKRVGELMKEKA